MKTLTLILLFMSLSTFLSAQTTVDTIRDYSIQIRGTEVPAKGFEIRKPETAYDLALNLSYLNYVSEGIKREFLVLPAAYIDDKPVGPDQLKQLPISNIEDYKFQAGITTQALFGALGQYGYLDIKTGKHDLLPVINPDIDRK